MSIRLISQVYEKKFDRAEQSIMICLADHAHDDGTHVYPSVPRIAWKTDYSDRQVRRIVKRLIGKKTLILVRQASANRPNEYRIDLSVIPNKPPFRPAPSDFDTSDLLAQDGADILSPLTDNVTPPLTDNVTLTVSKPSIETSIAAVAATPARLSAEDYRNRIANAVSGGAAQADGLTSALEMLTGRKLDPRNKTASGYVANLREWGATPDKCRHFGHYADAVLNAPNSRGEHWRGPSWKPTLKEVWESWETAMRWKPQANPNSLEAQGYEFISGGARAVVLLPNT